jgi:hypothetical protein
LFRTAFQEISKGLDLLKGSEIQQTFPVILEPREGELFTKAMFFSLTLPLSLSLSLSFSFSISYYTYNKK